MAPHVGGRVQPVRNALHAVARRGLARLTEPSDVPRTVQPVLAAAQRGGVQGL
jgi:hypothetical protein